MRGIGSARRTPSVGFERSILPPRCDTGVGSRHRHCAALTIGDRLRSGARLGYDSPMRALLVEDDDDRRLRRARAARGGFAVDHARGRRGRPRSRAGHALRRRDRRPDAARSATACRSSRSCAGAAQRHAGADSERQADRSTIACAACRPAATTT